MKRKWMYMVIVGVITSLSSSPFIFDRFQPLTIEAVENYNGLNGAFKLFEDLDGDGNDEIISSTIDAKGIIGLTFKGKGYPVWQENFNGSLFTNSDFSTSNIDGDSLREFSIVYFRNDSIFLGIVEYGSFDLLMIDRFLTTFKTKGRGEDMVTLHIYSFDFNQDQTDELVINVMNGYGIYPRRLFIFYPDDDIVYSTPTEWEAYISNTQIVDLDGDGEFEITVSGSAPGNSSDTAIEYHDHKRWVMVFDQYLELIGNPIGVLCNACGISLIQNGSDFLLHENKFDGIRKTTLWKIEKRNDSILYSLLLDNLVALSLFEDTLPSIAMTYEDVGKPRSFGVLDVNLKFTKLSMPIGNYQALELPLLDDKYFAILRNDELLLVNSTMDISRISLSIPLVGRVRFDGVSLNGQQFLFAQDSSSGILYKLTQNQFWYARLSSILGISLVSMLITFMILKFVQYRRNSYLATLYQLQMMALRNQLDPHFTLNLMSSIRLNILKNDALKADELFEKFTKILKYSLDKSEVSTVKLKEEIKLIELYLSIEKSQNDQLNHYQITIPEDLLDIEFPKMLIHEHVENAIKHGIRNLDSGDGEISIEASRKKDIVVIIICDNGVGRQHPSKESKGRGLNLTYQLIEIFNKLNTRSKVNQMIEDLERGTKVTITRKI